MAILYVFLFIFIFLSKSHRINSSTCKLNFSQFPYEAQSECFDIAANSVPSSVTKACCSSALQSLFKAMAIEANHSGSIFLELAEAKDCSNTFQNLHQSSNLAKCELQDLISSSTAELCSSTIDAIISFLGIERYNAFRSNCTNLYANNYSDETCFNCVMSYRQSLQALRKGDSSNGNRCNEALLVSLASSDVDSQNWVQGTFSCLWNEIEFSWPTQTHGIEVKENLLDSKALLATVIVAAVLVILAPLLYILTRKQIQYASEKDLKNLSVVVFKKEPEDEAKRPLNCSDLYIFSPDEMAKATDSFNNSNLIGEGILGKMYVGIMPSGMKAAIKRLNEGIELHNFIDEICRKAKIRHPNLVSTVGCCDSGDECLVYEYCVNGDLSSWLLGDKRTVILTWERRMQIFIGIARGLWFLHTNPLEKIVHGDIKARNAMMKGGSTSAMADPCLNGAYIVTEFQNVLSIAVQCTTPNEQERPNMEEVLQKLEETQILSLNFKSNCKNF
ncbi:G-type lectin S-receptor-like serine/threonine-protein kinase At1g61480 isoform X3 [Quercus suber]|uniref:G-type lectin S-receptor-like serine/threonine-protein kinase At1g61480 isoform X3 n=1 Tax=Quercus suber TaxID=58331 RepID=UPI0032DE6D14